MKYTKKRKSRKAKKRLTFILIVFFAAVIITVLFSVKGAAKISNITTLIINPVISVYKNTTDWISDSINAFSTNRDIIEENEDLKEKLLELESKQLLIKIYEDEIDDYKQLLDLQKELYDFEVVTAKILFSTVGNIQTGLTIDKGISDGIEKGMPVLFGDKLLGVTRNSDLISSRVRTIFEKDFAIIAINAENHEILRVRGDSTAYLSELMICDYLPLRSEIKVGDSIETSILGDVYPNAIKIGIVDKIEYDRDGIPVKAYIRPYIDPRDIDLVCVLRYKKLEGEDIDE